MNHRFKIQDSKPLSNSPRGGEGFASEVEG